MSEEPPEYYDSVYRCPKSVYTFPPELIEGYFELWSAAARSVDHKSTITDIGCGPGHFARVLRAEGHVAQYQGVDFSKVAINIARSESMPKCSFVCASALEPLPKSQTYTALEVLEHIDKDEEIVAAIPLGARFLFSLPNFLCKGHVRCFTDIEEVKARFDHLLSNISLIATIQLRENHKIFLCDSTRKDKSGSDDR